MNRQCVRCGDPLDGEHVVSRATSVDTDEPAAEVYFCLTCAPRVSPEQFAAGRDSTDSRRPLDSEGPPGAS